MKVAKEPFKSLITVVFKCRDILCNVLYMCVLCVFIFDMV